MRPLLIIIEFEIVFLLFLLILFALRMLGGTN